MVLMKYVQISNFNIVFFQEQRPEKPLLRTHNFPEQAFTHMEQNSSENGTNLDGQIG